MYSTHITEALCATDETRTEKSSRVLEFTADARSVIKELYISTLANENKGVVSELGEKCDDGKYRITIRKQNRRICDAEDLMLFLKKNAPELQIKIDNNSIIIKSEQDTSKCIIGENDIPFKENTAYLITLNTECNKRCESGYNTHFVITYKDGISEALFKTEKSKTSSLEIFESDFNKSISGIYLTLFKDECLSIDKESFGIYAQSIDYAFKKCEKADEVWQLYLKEPLYSISTPEFGAEDICMARSGKVKRKIIRSTLTSTPTLLKNNGKYKLYFVPLECERDADIAAHLFCGFTPVLSVEELENTPLASMLSPDCHHILISAKEGMDKDKLSEYIKEHSGHLVYARRFAVYEEFEKLKGLLLDDFNRIYIEGLPTGAKIKCEY